MFLSSQPHAQVTDCLTRFARKAVLALPPSYFVQWVEHRACLAVVVKAKGILFWGRCTTHFGGDLGCSLGVREFDPWPPVQAKPRKLFLVRRRSFPRDAHLVHSTQESFTAAWLDVAEPSNVWRA